MNSSQMAANLSLKQLHYFVTLADTLHFTQAAANCFVTQSTLSGGVRELEQQLGVSLFERDNKRVMLTSAGEALRPLAIDLLSTAGDFLQLGSALATPLQGRLTLGAIPTIAPFLLPKLMREARSRFPNLRVVLHEAQTHELLAALEAGRIDAALIATPMAVGRLAELPIYEEEMWLIASKSDAMAQQKAWKLKDVDFSRLMLLGEGHCLRDHALAACTQVRRQSRGEPHADIEASSLPTLIQMVEAGLGFSMLPEMAVKAGLLNGTDVIAQPFSAPPPIRGISLVTRSTFQTHPNFEALASLCKALVQKKTNGARRSRIG